MKEQITKIISQTLTAIDNQKKEQDTAFRCYIKVVLEDTAIALAAAFEEGLNDKPSQDTESSD